METTGAIEFVLGHERRNLDSIAPTQTVLEYLRGVERMTGTKEGCAEGDCGACTVVIGDLAGDEIRYSAVNSCIMFVPALHGRQLITVEHLRQSDGSLHAVQQAMVDEHGSQCGFCTPGFVMSLFAMSRARRSPSRETVDDALAGNLCRCTGYAPIVRAAQKTLGSVAADEFDHRRSESIAKLRSIDRESAISTRIDGQTFCAPRTCGQLAQILHDDPNARIVAGATDVGLWVTKQRRKLDSLVYVGGIDSLRKICQADGVVQIGAAASICDAMPHLTDAYPSLDEFFRRFGSEQIRNSATIGGNVANGSPIGDSIPALIAAGSTLQIASLQGERSLPVEDFFLDYGSQDLRRGEFIRRIDVPLPIEGVELRAYKISKRYHQDISAVCGAFAASVSGGTLGKVRIAYGGMAATPRRALQCERFLCGKRFEESTFRRAMEILKDDFDPITDFRASSSYRMQVAQNLLLRFYYDLSGRCAISVWDRQYA